MKTKMKMLVTSALLLTSLSTFAAETTWNFRNTNQISGSQLSGSVDGINLSITAWADSSLNNDNVTSSTIATANRGLLNYSGRTDRNGYEHTVGNRNNTNRSYGFSDFILFSFSEAVNLSNVLIGWSYRTTGYVSVAAYKGEIINPGASINGANKSWQDIATNDIAAKTIVEISNANRANNNLVSNISSLTGAVSGAVGLQGVFSKHWLVGAYNNAFDSVSRNLLSSFKLAGITTHVAPTQPNTPDGTPPSTPANAPGTLALLGLGLIALWRRQAQK